MPAHLQYNSPKSEPSPGSAAAGALSSPDGTDQFGKPLSRKRKSSADAEDDEDELDEDGNQPVKKTAHNMIEKRYRTNLNDKIAALRDSVPSLRIMSKSARGEDTTEDREELHGLTPAHKLNKATVLSKATEYIRHLEKRNNRLLDENGAMQARIAAFEKLFMAGAMTGAMSPMQQPPTPMQYPQDQYINTPMGTPRGDAPQGMMTVPEDMKRIIAAQMAAGQPYPIQQQQQAQQGARWGNNAPYFGKLMVGSLAGLMIIEAVRTEEQSNETPEGRGLFAVPMQLLSALKSSNFHVAGHVIPAAHFISHLKVLLFFGIFLTVFMPSLFAPSDKKQKKGAEQMSMAYCDPDSLGPKAQFLPGGGCPYPQNHEAEPTKHDRSPRLSGTDWIHRRTGGRQPASRHGRLLWMRNWPALHIRVLLWDLGSRGIHNTIATKLARSRWNEAKQLNRILTQQRRVSEQANDDELPEHLAALLEQECDNVLNCHIIRRAYNLAWNLPTTENANEQTEGMDAVVDDQAVRSPMDAVAAWWSSQEVQRALTASLNAGKDETESQEVVSSHLDNALKAAPVASGAQARALVARAVLVDEKRGASIASAIQTVQPGVVQAPINDIVSPILDSSSPAVQTPDVQVALRCAMAIAHLQRFKAGPAPRESTQLVEKLAQPSVTASMSLLGCTALFKLMTELHTHPSAAEAFSTSLERLAGSLRIWIGSTPGEQCGLDHDVRHKMVDRCLSITRSVVGMETDTGGSARRNSRTLACVTGATLSYLDNIRPPLWP
ncbi:Sterol regulatory element-binding protein 1 like [Verticillium longisporum]|nr:Sterol regulatory element-binding protein 1 like [Verticillium longisporum]